jgi:hypothetical protein
MRAVAFDGICASDAAASAQGRPPASRLMVSRIRKGRRRFKRGETSVPPLCMPHASAINAPAAPRDHDWRDADCRLPGSDGALGP